VDEHLVSARSKVLTTSLHAQFRCADGGGGLEPLVRQALRRGNEALTRQGSVRDAVPAQGRMVAKCIKNGGPVGIVSDGKAYLVVGAHKPMNDELAPLAGKTVTLKGKMASNGGISMLENAEIVKK